jgi:hypothetical protein
MDNNITGFESRILHYPTFKYILKYVLFFEMIFNPLVDPQVRLKINSHSIYGVS